MRVCVFLLFFFVFNYMCLLKRLSNVYIFLTHFFSFVCIILLSSVVVHLFFVWFFSVYFFSLMDLLCANCSSFFLVGLPSSLSLYCPLSSSFFIYYYYYYYYYYDHHHLVTLSFFVSRLRPLVREEERGKNKYMCIKTKIK